MNFWTFMDRNAEGCLWLVVVAIGGAVLFAVALSNGVSIHHIGDKPAMTDGGAP